MTSSEIDRTLKHVRIEEKAALRISRHYMQQCTNEMRHNAAARASKGKENNERQRRENAASARARKCAGIKRGLDHTPLPRQK